MAAMRVAILGGGNMGSAWARAIWESEGQSGVEPDQVVIAEPDVNKHALLRGGNACSVVASSSEAIRMLSHDGVVIVAVKPQVFGTLAAEVGDIGRRLVVSVMAGCVAARIHRDLGGDCRVVRAMPNLPVIRRQGMTALCAGPGATDADLAWARGVFGRLGKCLEVSESLMDAFTAVASSGTAYVLYLAEAMTRAAIELGIAPQDAPDIVRQTMWGASWLWNESDETAEELRQRVTSKGGTTQAATDVLDQAGVKEAVVLAIIAARDRGRELSKL